MQSFRTQDLKTQGLSTQDLNAQGLSTQDLKTQGLSTQKSRKQRSRTGLKAIIKQVEKLRLAVDSSITPGCASTCLRRTTSSLNKNIRKTDSSRTSFGMLQHSNHHGRIPFADLSRSDTTAFRRPISSSSECPARCTKD